MPDSLKLIELRELSSRKNFQKRQLSRSRVPATRRVHIGWMNKKNLKQFSLFMGYGWKISDWYSKTKTHNFTRNARNFFRATYFPDGENKIQGPLIDYTYYIGNCFGAKMKDILSTGDHFALEGYFIEIRTYPIRLYLFTSCYPSLRWISNYQ